MDDRRLLGDGSDLAVVVGHPRGGQRMGRHGVKLAGAPRVERAWSNRKAGYAEAGRNSDQGDVAAALVQVAQVAAL